MYKRILSLQDISCLGQCSLTVALPILSACGHETCIIPSAVLSTHTGGFKNFTFRDLTEDIPKISAHWKEEGISFDSIYTGYLGSAKQIEYVKEIFFYLKKSEGKTYVDPAMADNGRLYVGFDDAFVEKMRELISVSDVIIPNITEAALLTGLPYKEDYGEAYIHDLSSRLFELGAKCIVLTGVSFDDGSMGVAVIQKDSYQYYRHKKIPARCHGTGDIFASAFVGAAERGLPLIKAAELAANFTLSAIENTLNDSEHWYGAKFEKALPTLMKALEEI